MNFYISDLHFGHKNAIKFDNRPFSSVEEMNEILVQRWNKVVHPEDTVYVLGDFFWKRKDMLIYLPRLSGKIILICGNSLIALENETKYPKYPKKEGE